MNLGHRLWLWWRSLRALVGAVPPLETSGIPDQRMAIGPVGWVLEEHERLVQAEQIAEARRSEQAWLAELEAQRAARRKLS